MIANDKGGTNNLLDRKNAWTDASGALHIHIKQKSGRWSCAEIFLNRSLGYDMHSVTGRYTSHLEPNAVFAIFTSDERVSEQYYREMDVEVGRRGDAANKNNAQYAIQPFYNTSEVTERGRTRRVLVLVTLLLVAQLPSDRDGDR
jgi:hypothetical protein